MGVLTTITWNGPPREAGKREMSMAFRNEIFFSFVCVNDLHQLDKKALCSMSVLELG